MNFWATIEHSLNYKYRGAFPEDIKMRLQRAAEAAFRLDEEMSLIRGEIQEAQAFFTQKKDLKKDESS
jgi:putative GTP pyrophosphokinase